MLQYEQKESSSLNSNNKISAPTQPTIKVDAKYVILDDDITFSGHYHESKNKKYIAAFSRSHGLEDKKGKRTIILGRLYLIEGKSRILWKKEITTFDKVFVTDDGHVILCGNKKYLLFNEMGLEVYQHEFSSHICGVEFSETFSTLIISTFNPENKIYCFNVKDKKLIWTKNNLFKGSIRIIKFFENTIRLSVVEHLEDSYCIDLNSNLIEGSTKESELSKLQRLICTGNIKFNNKQYAEAESLFLQAYDAIDVYLFSWDDILGKDSAKFLEYLRKKIGVQWLDGDAWIKRAKIEKIDDDKTIKVYAEISKEKPIIEEKEPYDFILEIEKSVHSSEDRFILLKLNDEKNIADLILNYGLVYQFNVKTEKDKINIYDTLIKETEIEQLLERIAETKYKLKKYTEAIEYWEKAIEIIENLFKKLNISCENPKKSIIEKNIIKSYKKLISLNNQFEKSGSLDDLYKRIITKYPNQSIDLTSRTDLITNDSKKEFELNSINTNFSVKFLKQIKTKKKPGFVTFIDDGLIYTDGTVKPFNLIKTNNNFEIEWKRPFEENIRSIFSFGKTIFVYSLTWKKSNDFAKTTGTFFIDKSNGITLRAEMLLLFLNKDGKDISYFKPDAPLQAISFNSNFIALWSEDATLRLFSTLGGVVHEHYYSLKNKYDFIDISISDSGLILYSYKKMANLIDKNTKRLFTWRCPIKTIEEKGEGLKDIVSIKVYAEPFNEIRASKISMNSKYIFIGCYSGDLYCLNLDNKIVWHLNTGSTIKSISSSNDGDNLVVFCKDSYIYFITCVEIINKYKIMSSANPNGIISVKYHNTKEIFFISNGNELLIFDRIGNLLNRIILKNNINQFDISQNSNTIAVVSDAVFIFNFNY